MVTIPEYHIYTLINKIFTNVRDSIAADDNNNFVTRILGSTMKIGEYDLVREAKAMFNKTDLSDVYDFKIGFNVDTASLEKRPQLLLVIPNEQETNKTIGEYDEDNDINDTTKIITYKRFKADYALIIATNNSDKTVMIYRILQAMTSLYSDDLELAGLQIVYLKGGDLIQDKTLSVPDNVYTRVFTLSFDYEIKLAQHSMDNAATHLSPNGIPLLRDQDYTPPEPPESVPGQVTLVSPANGAADIIADNCDLQWADEVLSDDYELQIDNTAGFDTPIFSQDKIKYLKFTVPNSVLDINNTYYWRVRGRNVLGNGAWSVIRSFITVDVPTLPAVPTLVSPADAYASGLLRQPLLWTVSDRATSFDLQVATDINFTSLVINQSSLTSTAYIPTADLINTTYYWKVRAKNSFGTSAWTAVRTFVVTEIENKNPSQISNNNLWLRSDLGVTEVSGKVSQWDDQSSGGSNFSQSNVSLRPTKVLNVYNSKPAIYFNPVPFATSGQVLSYNDTTNKYNIINTNQGSFMIILMSDGTNFDFASNYFCPMARSNTNNGGQYGFVRGVNTGPAGHTLGYPFPSGDYAQISLGLNIPHQIIVTANNAVTNIYLDGILVRTLTVSYLTIANNANTYFNLGQYYAGANYPSGRFTGYIFEVAFWNNKVLSATEVSNLKKYYKNNYGIT